MRKLARLIAILLILVPASFAATVIRLTWNPVSVSPAVTAFRVYRGTSSGGESTTPLATLGVVTTYDDAAAVPGTTYYYFVTAVNSNGEGPASNEAHTVIPVGAVTLTPGSLIYATGGTTQDATLNNGTASTITISAITTGTVLTRANIETSATNWAHCVTVACAGGAVDATSATQTFGVTSTLSMTGPPNSNALFYNKVNGSGANSADHFVLDFKVTPGANAATAQTFEFDIFQSIGGRVYMFGSQCNQVTGFWQIWDELGQAWSNTAVACALSPSTLYHIQWTVHRVSGSNLMYYDTLTINGTPYAINTTKNSGIRAGFGDAVGANFQMDEGASGTSLSEVIQDASYTATSTAGFTQTNACGSSLGAGLSCAIHVTAPLIGGATGALTETDNTGTHATSLTLISPPPPTPGSSNSLVGVWNIN